MFGRVLRSGGVTAELLKQNEAVKSPRQERWNGEGPGTLQDRQQGCWQNKSGSLHAAGKAACCTLFALWGKCCHQLNKVEGRRERRSGKLREDCCFVLKATSTRFFLNSILVEFCSDPFHYQLSTLRSIKYYSVFIPYEVLKLLIKYSI